MINEIKDRKLILTPFFQRKLVWRIAHKVDFIKTILLGYPFPEIFISRGNIDLATMQSTSALVDGQQRMNTIKEFLDDKVVVDGGRYSELTPAQKETFLKYEIAIIDLEYRAGRSTDYRDIQAPESHILRPIDDMRNCPQSTAHPSLC